MMTRKDYVATANILKDYLDELGIETMSDLVEDFSDYFLSDNPLYISRSHIKNSYHTCFTDIHIFPKSKAYLCYIKI